MNFKARDMYQNRRVFVLEDEEFLDVHIRALDEVTKSMEKNIRQLAANTKYLETISENLNIFLKEGT